MTVLDKPVDPKRADDTDDIDDSGGGTGAGGVGRRRAPLLLTVGLVVALFVLVPVAGGLGAYPIPTGDVISSDTIRAARTRSERGQPNAQHRPARSAEHETWKQDSLPLSPWERFIRVQRDLATEALDEYIQHVGSAIFAVPPDSWYGTLLKGVFTFQPDPAVRQVTVWVLYLVPTLALFLAPVGFASGKGKVKIPDEQGARGSEPTEAS